MRNEKLKMKNEGVNSELYLAVKTNACSSFDLVAAIVSCY